MSISNVIVSKPTSAKNTKILFMMNFIGILVNMDLDHPPKSIDFMLHGGFLSAGGVYLIVIT